jgi:hypothetical protein
MLLRRFGSPIIGFERADFPMSGHVHDAENIGALVQSGRDETSA